VAPRQAVAVELARRLQRKLVEKGWNQSELARRAALHTASKRFGRDNVSNYIRAVMIPGPVHLNAMARALDCSPDELLPARAVPSSDDRLPPFKLEATGDGMAWLQINQEMPFGTAIKIAALLEEAKAEED
jgi:transcriptional regulator with XRE-family HTH domain